MSGLTPRKRLFVAELLADPNRNATQAVIRAGYSKTRATITASELMHDPKIKDAIANKLTRRAEKLEITTDLQILKCQEVIERCKEAGSGSWQEQTILKAVELQSRLGGLFTEKVQVGLDDKLMEQLLLGRKRAALNLPPGEELQGNDGKPN